MEQYWVKIKHLVTTQSHCMRESIHNICCQLTHVMGWGSFLMIREVKDTKEEFKNHELRHVLKAICLH